MSVHTRIRQFREAKELTHQQFADAVGVSRGAVQQWESGATAPARKKQPAVATFMGITVAELMADDAPPQSTKSSARRDALKWSTATTGGIVFGSALPIEPVGSADGATQHVVSGKAAFMVLGELLKGTDPVTAAQIAPLIEQLSKTPELAAELGERLDATLAMGSSQATPFKPINPFPKK